MDVWTKVTTKDLCWSVSGRPVAFPLHRHNLDLAAQTAYFIGIVITQIGNLYGNKTSRRSVFQQGIFGNRFMVFAVGFTITLACFLLYTPKLNRALNLSPNRFLWWLPAIPFFLYLFSFNEVRKFFIRKYPNRFPARQLLYWTFALFVYCDSISFPFCSLMSSAYIRRPEKILLKHE